MEDATKISDINSLPEWLEVPLNADGDTVHLHICPCGTEDTDVFDYNLVKRGYKYGLQIVETVKS